MKPTHAGAKNELGLLHLGGAGVARDERRALELLNVAAKQGHLEAAFKPGCLHMDRGELLEAQRAFEEALHAEGTLPRERANAAYNLGIVHQGQGNVVESEGCFWHAREEGCLRAPYNLGSLYLERGNTDKARRLLEEALRGDLVAQAACALRQYYEAHRCPKRAKTYYE